MSTLVEDKTIALKTVNSRQKEFLSKIEDCIKNDFELFSFDVFDTLITRATFEPKGIFLLIQEELKTNPKYSDIPEFIRNNFMNLRFGSESFLNRTRYQTRLDRPLTTSEAQQEFSLEEFYQIINKNNLITNEQIEELINLELETELKNSIPIKENIEILRYIISKNKKVVLISDMYLKSEEIRKLLLQHDKIFKDVKIYVSSEYNKRKINSELFATVAKLENIEDYSKWLHIGDNETSDIKAGEKLKIKTYFFPKEEKTEFEEHFYTDIVLSSIPEAQIFLGINVNSRRFLIDNKQADFATFATTIFYPYVKWIIDKSLKDNINRLYFIARDGYVLKEIADIIIKQNKIQNLSTHYIYGSRQAWRTSASESFEEFAISFNYLANQTNLRGIAIELNVKIEDLQKFLNGGFKDINKTLTQEDLTNIRNILKNKPEFVELLKEKNKEQRELLKEYLEQNIDFSDENFAFVDLTCSGITAVLISNVIKRNFNVKSKNFVISLSRKIKSENSLFYDYLHLLYKFVIIESLGKAPHGLTIKYKKENNKVLPVLDNSEKFEYFKDYIEAIKYQTKLLDKTLNTNNLKTIHNLSFQIMTEVDENFTNNIAKYFNSLDFSERNYDKKYKLEKNNLNIFDTINLFYFKNKLVSRKYIEFALKNSGFIENKLAEFFMNHPKITSQNIKKSIKYSKMAIKNSIWRKL